PDPAASTARRPGVVAMPRFRFSRWTGAGVRPRDVQPLRTTGGSDAPDPPEEPESPGMSSTPIRPRLLPPRNRRKTQRCPEPPIQRTPGERPFRRDRADPARTPAPPRPRPPPGGPAQEPGPSQRSPPPRGERASGGASPPPAAAPRQRSRAQATGRFHGKRIHGHARSCDHGGVPTTPPAPVLLVASSGGHLAQLWSLRPWWSGRARAWVTFDTPDAAALLGGEEEVHWAHHPTTRSIANLLRNTGLAARVLTARRPA